MSELIFSLLYSLSCGLRSRARLHLEIIALRHQLGVLQRKVPARTRLKVTDRWLWVALSRLWSDWRSSLVIVKPGTVVAWHRKGFRLYWTWKSRQRIGRPKINTEVREIIQKMSRANPLWGAPRIHGELLKLGLDVSQATVAKYMLRSPRPPSQSWRTFLDNHISQLASVDFFTIPTVWFEVLFMFVVLAHYRRRSPPLQRHGSSYGCLDSTANPGGLPVRDRSKISPSRSRRHLRTRIPATNRSHGHCGSTRSSPVTLATCLCRTNHRLDSTRLSRPDDRLQPIITSPNSSFLPRLLSWVENSPFARQGRSGTAAGAASRKNRRDPTGRRTSSPIRTTSRLSGGPIPFNISSHPSTSQPLSVSQKPRVC